MNKHPLETAHEAILAAIAELNNENAEYNALVDDNNALEARLCELEKKLLTLPELQAERDELSASLKMTNDALTHIHADRKALLDKHNESVTTANAEIQRLMNEVSKRDSLINQMRSENNKLANELLNANAELKPLRAMDPKAMKKRLDNANARNDELKAENARMVESNRTLTHKIDTLKAQLVEAGAELWNGGSEKLFKHNENSIVAMVGDRTDVVGNAIWWQHERGMRLLCAYSPELDKILICDPRNEDGNMFTPTMAAEEAMMRLFKGEEKPKKKASTTKRKKAA